MVLSIARQSVVIKCNLEASVMTGNYEFYYASGLLCKIKGISMEEILEPMELFEEVQRLIEGFETDNPKEAHLVRMLRFYKPVRNFDEQMKELFVWGQNEKNMWQEA